MIIRSVTVFRFILYVLVLILPSLFAQAQGHEIAISTVINEVLIGPLQEQLVHQNTNLTTQSGSEFGIRVTFKQDRLQKILIVSRRTDQVFKTIRLMYGDVESFKNVPVGFLIKDGDNDDELVREADKSKYRSISKFWNEMHETLQEMRTKIQWDAITGDLNTPENRARIKVAADLVQTRLSTLSLKFAVNIAKIVEEATNIPRMRRDDSKYESNFGFINTENENNDELLLDKIEEARRYWSRQLHRKFLIITATVIMTGAAQYFVTNEFIGSGSAELLGLGFVLGSAWVAFVGTGMAEKTGQVLKKYFGASPTDFVFKVLKDRFANRRTLDPKKLQQALNQKMGNVELRVSNKYAAEYSSAVLIVPQEARVAAEPGFSFYDSIIRMNKGAVPFGAAHLQREKYNGFDYLAHVTTLGSTKHITEGQPARAAAFETETIKTALKSALIQIIRQQVITTVVIPALGTEAKGKLSEHPYYSAQVILDVIQELRPEIERSRITKIQVVATEPLVFDAFQKVAFRRLFAENYRHKLEPSKENASINMCLQLFAN